MQGVVQKHVAILEVAKADVHIRLISGPQVARSDFCYNTLPKTVFVVVI